MLKQRLAWEIRALQSSKEQLLTEGGSPARVAAELGCPRDLPAPPLTPRPPTERQARAKLEEVEQRLRSPPEVPGASAEKDG